MKKKNRWRPWLTLAALLASGSTWAASVTPTTHDGNFDDECHELGAGLIGGTTTDKPGEGEVVDLGNGQSITFTYTPPGGNFINFTATVPIDYIIVKGGSAYNVFQYSPGVLSDTGLFAPVNASGGVAGVSHVSYCFSPKPTGSKTATATWKSYTDWKIDKSVTPENIKMFDGDSHDVEYTVTATPTTNRKVRVAGTITAKDPFDAGWAVTNVADVVVFNNSDTKFTKVWDAGGTEDTMQCNVPAPNDDDIVLSCSYEFLLDSEEYGFLLDSTHGTNSAAINFALDGATHMVTATAQFSIPETPTAIYGNELKVDDSVLGGNPDHTFTVASHAAWKYERTFTCDKDEGENENTATGTFDIPGGGTDTVSDTATVNVACETVSISKDATTTYKREYAWDPEKYVILSPADATGNDSCLATPIATGPYAGFFRCDDAEITLNPGDTYDTVYELQANQTQDDTTFAVGGNINVVWPAGMYPDFDPAKPIDILTFTDGANGTKEAEVTCSPQADGKLDCTYTATLPREFVTGFNTATIDRVKKCYAVDGTPSDCGGTVTYTSNQPSLDYGPPSSDSNKCISVTDLFNQGGLNLGVGFDWIVDPEVCESFSTFVTGDVDPTVEGIKLLDIVAGFLLPTQTGEEKSCKFMVPNLLRLSNNNGEDEAVVDVTVTQLCEPPGCTYTQGYWKTHVSYAAKPQFAKKRDATWDEIDGAGVLNENADFYLSGQSYIQVMWTAPAGNVYYNLAHQFIAAQLNILDGASSTAVAAEIAQATALFNQYPPNHNYWKSKAGKATATTLAGKLASFNEGLIGPGHCSESPASIKAAR